MIVARNASKGCCELVIPMERYVMPGTTKESVRDIYQVGCPQLAAEFTHQLSGDLQDRSLPREVNRLGRTIARWATQITNWHHSAVTNVPTEGLNNLIKQIKRTAFGFRNFANYRIRTLLYAGKPSFVSGHLCCGCRWSESSETRPV